MDSENLFGLIQFAIVILTLAGMWKVYTKAGRKGWESIIPIYNLYVLTKIVKKPAYWTILMLIPFIGIIWNIWAYNLLAKNFGKGEGTTLGLIFLPFIFFPMLGFGEAEYLGSESENEIEAEVINETEA